jgi:hypothetical protein
MGQDRNQPWEGLQQTLALFSSNVASNLQQVAQHVERQVQPWQRNMGNLVQGMQQLMAQQHLQQQQRQQQQRHIFAPLAVSEVQATLICLCMHASCRGVSHASF